MILIRLQLQTYTHLRDLTPDGCQHRRAGEIEQTGCSANLVHSGRFAPILAQWRAQGVKQVTRWSTETLHAVC